MKRVFTVASTMLALSLTACTPQNAENRIGNATNSAAGFVNQTMDVLNTPNALHQGSSAAGPRSSAMGENNSGMQARLGAIDNGALGGNSTVQVDNRSKTVRLVYTSHASTSSSGMAGLRGATTRRDTTDRMSGISIPIGWNLEAMMRHNAGANTNGGATSLSIVPYSPRARVSAPEGSRGTSATRASQTGGFRFAAKHPGMYAVLMHQTGVQPFIVTIVSVTPTIKVPVVSFPAT